MSFPTIVVSPSNVPSSIQVATPFSYTFSNSGIAPASSESVKPIYSPSVSGQVTLCNSGSYSSNNTLITSTTDTYSISTITGIYYPGEDIAIGSDFVFQVPYAPTPAIGSIGFTPNGWSLFNVGDTWKISNSTYGCNFEYTSNTTIRYEKAAGGFDVFSNSSTTKLFTDTTPNLQFYTSFYWFPWTPSSPAADWDDTITYNELEQVTYDRIVYQSLQNVNKARQPDINPSWWTNIEIGRNFDVSFRVEAVDKIIYFPETYPLLNISSLTSTEILPFISGNATTELTFSSSNGFQGIPSSNLTLEVYQTIGGNRVAQPSSSNTITVRSITITTTPTLGSTLSLYTYQPFSYVYSIPNDVVNVLLRYNSSNTSSSLVPYISGDTFESTIGLTVPGTSFIEFESVLSNVKLGSNRTTITTLAPIVTATPSIPTGSLNLYKYEPFSYVFTLNPESVGLTFQFSRSSSQITPYCSLSTDKLTLTYSGTYLATSSSVLNLFVDVMYGTTIVTTTTIRIAIGRGRFFPPSSNQLYQLYQNEAISNTLGSNPVFSSVSEFDSIVSIPSLPNGLSFSSPDLNTAFLQGTPTLPVAQSTYTIFGNNSSNGNVVSTPIVIRVNAQQIFVTPSSASLSNLTVGTAITPIQFVTRQPTAPILSFQYTWETLPDGIVFQDLNGSNVSQGYGSNTIQLAGTPSLQFAKLVSSNSNASYSTRLTATQVQTNGTRLTGSSLITFSLGQTVLFSDVIIPQLYDEENLNSKNVFFSAITFSNGSNLSNIQSITAASLPVGLDLSSISLSNRVQLIGTPTVVGTADYVFTASNVTGISRTQSFTIPILPDIITFGSETPVENTPYSFIISKPITPISFSATSSANKTISWSISLPNSYGLTISSTTGTLITLSGTPTFPLTQTAVVITASDILGTTASRTILITIENDIFTWPTYTPTYIQNVSISPFTFNVMTASDRLIQLFTSTGLPKGLILNQSGVLSGIPVSGSGNVISLSCNDGEITFVLSSTDGYLVGQTINIRNVPTQVFRDGVRRFPPLIPDPEDPYPGETDSVYEINGDYIIDSITTTNIVCSTTLPNIIESSTAIMSLKGGSFTINASTGYFLPPTSSQIYSYSIIPDNVLTLLNVSPTMVPLIDTNGVLTFSISNVFTAISYSGFPAENSINPASVQPSELNPIITLVNNVLSGTISQLPDDDPSFTFTVTGTSGTVQTDVNALLSFPNRTTAILTLRTSPGFLSFRLPTFSSYTLFQYCPMPPITFSIVEAEAGYDFTYYYSTTPPLGMTFTTETSGTNASLTGIPVTYSDTPVSMVVYAANGPNVIFKVVSFRILTPNFINPQVGAGAYTAILKSDVEGNAAQNARDQRVFPTSNPLAGPLMAPRAPDVITQANCFLGLCKKPCPTCRTMM